MYCLVYKTCHVPLCGVVLCTYTNYCCDTQSSQLAFSHNVEPKLDLWFVCPNQSNHGGWGQTLNIYFRHHSAGCSQILLACQACTFIGETLLTVELI